MKIENVKVGQLYIISAQNESGFEVGEEVEVVAIGVLFPDHILVKSTDPNCEVASMSGEGTQLVELFELEEM